MEYKLFNDIKSNKGKLIKDKGYNIIDDKPKPKNTEDVKPINTFLGKAVDDSIEDELSRKNAIFRDDITEKKGKLKSHLLSSLVPSVLSGAGDLMRVAGKFGGMNNGDSANVLTPLANIATETGLQAALHDTSFGLGAHTNALLQEIGAVNTPGWAKLQLLEKLMQNRDAAFQRRLQYGFNR